MNRQRNGYSDTGKGSARLYYLDGYSPSFQQRLMKQAHDYRGDLTESEELLLPEWMHPAEDGYQEYPAEIKAKVDKLFQADKFKKQKEVMSLCFDEGLTSTEIAEMTGQDTRNVRRAITMGLKKIKVRLTAEEWQTIKWYYRVKGSDLVRSNGGRFNTKEELKAYEKEVQAPSEVITGRLINGEIVFD
ncbi:sigma factor-like helix-turn-helix DNA-binding protein [Bacillus sp. es.034]|uniref:sigma factor-like helix-turn-helix DNA-binding protein n=1 Tax=Bacillus sp. es.034 TaxID=1761763 RepID=UPI000BF70E98|nr:sigma factor-like helix-turn-helix DNA-binding protein [Bacillus sp. es.034]PFG07162.1 sigma-70-like protein [Bacillus sp. es.034]